MSKRLENIKTWLNRGFDLTEEETDWLIEQVERVEELEKAKQMLQDDLIDAVAENTRMKEQNKRYREEIEFAREELFLALCESKSELEKRHHVKSARHFLLKALEGEEE